MPLVGLCQFISLLQKSAQYVFIWITCQVISLPNSGTLSLCCMWKLQKKKAIWNSRVWNIRPYTVNRSRHIEQFF